MFLWNLFKNGTAHYKYYRWVIYNLLCLSSTPFCKFITCNSLNLWHRNHWIWLRHRIQPQKPPNNAEVRFRDFGDGTISFYLSKRSINFWRLCFQFIRRSKGKENACCSFMTAWCCIPCAFGQMGAYLNENPIQTV